MPRAPLMIVPPMSVVGVFRETANVNCWPTRARAWKFEWATLIVTDPLAVVEAAAKFESVPLRMYVTFGADLLGVGDGPFASATPVGIANATTTSTSVSVRL